MPQSLAGIYLHAVFSTKQRAPFLVDPVLRRNAHAYLAGVTNRLGCAALEIGGVEDHVHLLVRFGRTTTVADWIKETKRASSSFLKQHVPEFSWQSGYGVFSVDPERLGAVTLYIRGQEEHHRKFSFQDEFRALLREYDIEWDENYVWD